MGRRPQQQAVHDTEHRGVGADAQGQRESHREREGGLPDKGARGLRNVGAERAPLLAPALARVARAVQAA